MLTHHIAVTDGLEIVSWTANTPTSPRHSLRVAIAALGRCNCFAELHDLAGCLISYSFYCVACDEWHVEEGGPIKFTELHA